MKVDIKPISINKCWRGRRFKTPEYAAWRTESMRLIKKNKLKMVEGKCTVHLSFHCSKNYARADVDNMIKPALDSLVDAGAIKDDRYIEKIIVEKMKSKTDFWEFYVEAN